MERPAGPAAPRDLPPPTQGGGADPRRDAELDKELKDTFPASDPAPPKHVD